MKLQRFIFFLSVVVLFSLNTQAAETFSVKKSKGRQAVIESSIPLIEGETYIIQTGKQSGLISEDVNYPKSNRSRQNSLAAGINSSFFKADNLQEHQIEVEARYGWNFGAYEIGPLLHIHLLDEGAGFNSEFSLGGYFDYNFTPNVARAEFVYGLTAQAFGGNREFTNGSSSQIFALGAGGFLSWFLMGSTTALKFEGLIESKKIATSSVSTSATGFVGKMLFAFYY